MEIRHFFPHLRTLIKGWSTDSNSNRLKLKPVRTGCKSNRLESNRFKIKHNFKIKHTNKDILKVLTLAKTVKHMNVSQAYETP